ncbi:MAG TPA: Glu/Leu/Phe/Val dehydrogenase dimerization domain-containing protein [Conexibacter sp.]|nr:Glu/Leu/Phe/Val dehydrogenase dimerization domain-containing protein [Conexibacter sp.]
MTEDVCEALEQSLSWEHERVELVHDADSGLEAVLAIHSTVLGPALGGLRLRRYAGGLPEALDDALRLSRAMTLKASAAGLDLGGGKAVVLDDGAWSDPACRTARLRAVARELERLGGAYVTAEDVGTSTADMDLIAERTRHVVGTTRGAGLGGDPSPSTVRTVLGAIAVALEVRDGDDALAGRSVGVVGLGKVGGRLAARLVGAGARVVGVDPDAAARRRASVLGVEIASTADELLARPLDVLAPCALGGLIDEATAASVRCRVVCGSANNPLTGEPAAAQLARRGVLYVPDFLANCGGLIQADCERRGVADPARLERALAAARARTRAVLREASERGALPSAVAEQHAWTRIHTARREPSAATAA